jgi:nitroreductase
MNLKQGLGVSIRSLFRLLQGRPQVPATLADNAFLQVIYKRRSVRSFTAQPIPEDIFAAILEAGRIAPSAVNLQTWAFAVFDNALWHTTFGRSIPFHANRAVIVISDTHRDRQVLDAFPCTPLIEHTVGVMNASLAAMSMNLTAEALGISSVMLSETGRTGLLDVKYLQEALHLPSKAIPIMTIVFGYARGPYLPMPPRLPAEQVFFGNEYQPPNPAVMQSWLAQMVAGYNLSHTSKTFQDQLTMYQGKFERAEAELHAAIMSRGDEPRV